MADQLARVIGCPECGHLTIAGENCEACRIRAAHREGCAFRLSATCAIPIECEHGYDVCPTCDPCSCAEVAS